MNFAATNGILKFKKSIDGPELQLVESFRNTCDKVFNDDLLDRIIFTEPYIGVGIPDIVIVFWEKDVFKSWKSERNLLEKTDIKILHHMYLKDDFLEIEVLERDLGYAEKEIEKTLERLMDADLLVEHNRRFKLEALENVFFTKSIISIEAKIKNWKHAINQALLNEWFASESYILLPQEKINPKIIGHANDCGVGVIAHKKDEPNIMQPASKREIPASYSSWLFNENVGRTLYTEDFS